MVAPVLRRPAGADECFVRTGARPIGPSGRGAEVGPAGDLAAGRIYQAGYPTSMVTTRGAEDRGRTGPVRGAVHGDLLPSAEPRSSVGGGRSVDGECRSRQAEHTNHLSFF